ncbi:MAG: multiheme c-type cytochrome [Candidatus Methanofastidiosia archaeon]
MKLHIKIILVILAFVLFSSFIHTAPEYEGSLSCKECHEELYDQWANSLHAQATSDPIFEASYLLVLREKPEEKEFCLRCHSPTTALTKDFNLELELSREGVTCDFCHTVSDLKMDGVIEYIPKVGNIKFGKSKREITEHGLSFRNFFSKSEFCGGCHQFLNSNGVPVIETYEEWKSGPYFQKKECQDCHMEMVENVRSHRFAGGHLESKVTSAAQVKLDVEIEERSMKVKVYVTNSGSGHKIPTGIPSRRLILHLVVRNSGGEIIFKEDRVYEKVLVDAEGEVLKEDHRLILDSERILKDNRIAPLETRIEEFEFEVPQSIQDLDVSAELEYSYKPQLLTKTKLSVLMAKESKFEHIGDVSKERVKVSKEAFFWVLLLTIPIIVMLYEILRRRK